LGGDKSYEPGPVVTGEPFARDLNKTTRLCTLYLL